MGLSPTESPYVDRVREGDAVRLPDGRLATVTLIEHLPRRNGAKVVRLGGSGEIRCAKIVSVMPQNPRRFLWFWTERPIRFADADIEALVFIVSRDEIEGIDPDASLSQEIAALAR